MNTKINTQITNKNNSDKKEETRYISAHQATQHHRCEVKIESNLIAHFAYNESTMFKEITIVNCLPEAEVFPGTVKPNDISSLLCRFRIEMPVISEIGVRCLYKEVNLGKLFVIAGKDDILLISNKSKILGKYLSDNGYDFGLISKSKVVMIKDSGEMSPSLSEHKIKMLKEKIEALNKEKTQLVDKIIAISYENKMMHAKIDPIVKINHQLVPLFIEIVKEKDILFANELEPDLNSSIVKNELPHISFYLCIKCNSKEMKVVNHPCLHSYYCYKCAEVSNETHCLFCERKIEKEGVTEFQPMEDG